MGVMSISYDTQEYGEISRIEYPHDDDDRVRVYAKNLHHHKYVPMSCLHAGMIGAEAALEGYLLDRDCRPDYDYAEDLIPIRKYRNKK